MIMRKIIFFMVFYAFTSSLTAQNKQILYGFDKIPQTLLLNPGAEPTYKYHIAVPLLSGISADVNMSGVTVTDLFKTDKVSFFQGSDFNTRFKNAIDNLDSDDYAYINSQVEILNAGYKINNKDYISAGFYTEADAFLGFPKDIVTLIDKGNAAYINKPFLFSQINVRTDVVGVLHAGISRKFNSRFTAGTRLKLYSGAINVISTGNAGTFTTNKGTNGSYVHTLNDIDIEVNSSGVYDKNDEINITTSDLGRTFFGGNFGAGLDVGFTYYMDEQLQFTASVLDIGFISYSKDVKTIKVEGDYTFSGINLDTSGARKDYWTEFENDFNTKLPREKNSNSYSVMRPMKFNGAIRYSFGRSRNESNCYDISYKEYYTSALGGQLYSVFTPLGPKFALTAFFEKRIGKYLNTKFTYTFDDFSYTNFGVGLSANVWKLNVYGVVDNVFKLPNIANAHRASFQLGVNFVHN